MSQLLCKWICFLPRELMHDPKHIPIVFFLSVGQHSGDIKQLGKESDKMYQFLGPEIMLTHFKDF